MQITLTPELETQLLRVAHAEGRSADQLAIEVFSRGLDAEARFLTAVGEGLESARQGDLLTSEEVWAAIETQLARNDGGLLDGSGEAGSAADRPAHSAR